MKRAAVLLVLGTLGLSAVEGEVVYKKCAMCHGKQGEKVALQSSPRLNTLNEEELSGKLKALLNGSSSVDKRYVGMHKAKLKGVREEDTPAIAKYILSLK